MDDPFPFLSDDQNRLMRLVYGLSSEKPVSLQEASGILQISYENARVLHHQVRERLQQACREEKQLWPAQNVITSITQRGGLLSHVRLADEIHCELAETGYQASRMLDMLVDCRCLEPIVKEVPSLSAWALREKEDHFILGSASSIIDILSHVSPVYWSELYAHLTQFPGLFALEETLGFAVVICLQDNGQIQQSEDGLWWLLKGENLADLVWKIIHQARQPLKLIDVQQIVLGIRQVSPRSVISAIEHDARFFRNQEGAIWLTEHGHDHQKTVHQADPYRCDRLVEILIALDHPDDFHTITQIHNAQNPGYPLTPSTVRDLLLKKQSIFVRTGPQIFGLATWGLQPAKPGPSTASDRLGYILQETGGPMHYQDLYREHNRRYPTHRVKEQTVFDLLIAPDSQFICISDGIFKLSDNPPKVTE